MSPNVSTLGELFCAAAGRFPERPALVHGGRTWTYAALARVVAAGVPRMSVDPERPGGRVAIVGNNHPAYVIGYFAAQCAGASTVEIGRNESLETLVRRIEPTQPRFLLTDREDLRRAFEDRVRSESFQSFMELVDEGAATRNPLPSTRQPEPSDEASVIFTSGTTGVPKGVVLTHANFLFVTRAVCEYLALGAGDRYALVLPLSHTYGKSNLLTTIAAGGAVVMLDGFADLPTFISTLSAEACTVMSAVPYHANLLLKRGALGRHDLSSLRILTFSGNHLSMAVAEGLQAALPSARIFAMYGLTETTTRTCFLPADLLFAKRGSCGRPLPGVDLQIRNDAGAPVLAGETGEVMVRGPNVMRSYFQDPVLTDDTLIDGWLATGDLGYVDEEGFLYLTGRKKDIIKCAGERISPVEIEEVLASFPGVVDAAVIGAPDETLGESVLAFVVAGEGFGGEAGLRAHCARHLSHHKLPRRYAFVQSLPKTATGKTQKQLLRRGGQEWTESGT